MVRSRVSRVWVIAHSRGAPPSLCPRQTGEREVEGSSLVTDRDRHVLDLELTDRLQHPPTDVRIDLDLEVIHALQRLMIFLAEHHLPFGLVAPPSFPRLNTLFKVGVFSLGAPRHNRHRGG